MIAFLAASCSIVGAGILATAKPKIAFFGWVLFLIANLFWLMVAFKSAQWALFAQNAVFTLTSLYGLYNARKALNA